MNITNVCKISGSRIYSATIHDGRQSWGGETLCITTRDLDRSNRISVISCFFNLIAVFPRMIVMRASGVRTTILAPVLERTLPLRAIVQCPSSMSPDTCGIRRCCKGLFVLHIGHVCFMESHSYMHLVQKSCPHFVVI